MSTIDYTAYPGIDYGHGQVNIDTTTGIRYGVISMNDICQAWSDESEADYGMPACPTCGSEDITDVPNTNEHECKACGIVFDCADAYPDEPLGYYVNDRDYEAHDCLDNDVMVTRSPYYTHAQFCSPCVPGAGNLNTPMAEGPRTYCFGHDWFEDGAAPYPVYSVATGKLVLPTP